MTTDLKIRLIKCVKEASVDINCHHSPCGSDLRTEPPGDRTCASSDLKALPSIREAERTDAAASPRIKTLFEQRKTLPRSIPGIIKGITTHNCLLHFFRAGVAVRSHSIRTCRDRINYLAKSQLVGTRNKRLSCASRLEKPY